MITKNCLVCGKEFEIRRKREKDRKYCSKKCYGISKLGIPTWNKGKPNTWYNPKGLEIGHGWNKGKSAIWAIGNK